MIRMIQRRLFTAGRVPWGQALFVAVLALGAWGPAVRAAEEPAPPEIDTGLTDEEKEFLDIPISELDDAGRKRRDDILARMKDRLLKMMEKREEAKRAAEGEQEGKKDEPKVKPKPPVRRPPKRATPRIPARVNKPEAEDDEAEEPDRAEYTPLGKKSYVPPREPLVVPEGNELLPYDKRLYKFGYVNASYIDIVQGFSRQSGLSVQGVPVKIKGFTPEKDEITYVSTGLTDFRTTLSEINDLLFYEVTPPLYLYFDPTIQKLKLDAFKELRQQMPPERLFTNLEAVDQAVADNRLTRSDIVRVFFSPGGAAQMKVFNEMVVNMFGEQVLMTVIEHTGLVDFTGRVDILEQVRAYLEKFVNMEGEKLKIVRLDVKHVKPSEAITRLNVLVENMVMSVEGPRASRGRQKKEDIVAESEKVYVIADDDNDSLIVTGLPYKIDEVREALAVIDIGEPDQIPNMPVPLKLEHAKAEDVADALNQIVNDHRVVKNIKGGGGARNKGRSKVVASNEEDRLSITPDPRTNSLILQGPDELIEFATRIVKELLDKKRESILYRPVQVIYRDPGELADVVEDLIREDKKDTDFKIEVTGKTLLLKGDPTQMSDAEELIKVLDREAGGKETFAYRLHNAKASTVVEILQLREPEADKKAKGRRASRDGNYHADDDVGVVFFTGTTEEWQGEIQPLIAMIDDELQYGPPTETFEPLRNAEPKEVAETLKSLYGDKKGERPKFAEAPNGVIISGAPESQLEGIRQTIKMLDVSLYGPEGVQRQTFDVYHAEPGDVEKAVTAMFSEGTKRKGRRVVSPDDELRIASTPTSVIVRAPADMMSEIAELIAQVDKDPTDPNAVDQRTFPLDHADPDEVQEAIGNLYGPDKRRKNAEQDFIKMASTPGGLIVITGRDKMTQVAELIHMMDAKEIADSVETRRFEVAAGDIENVAMLLEPILQARLADVDSRSKKKAKRGKEALVVQPDFASNSVWVTAPQALLEYTAQIFPKLDVLAANEERVLEIYECHNAKAEELATLLSVSFAGGKPAKGSTRGARGGKSREEMLKNLAGGDSEVEILPLPGDKAISITGTRHMVDNVLARAAELDAKSAATEPITRTFTLSWADVDEVANAIIEMLDEPAKGARKKATTDDSDTWDDVFDTGPRRSAEIAVWPDYETGTIIVHATPAKLAAVEMLIAEKERIANPETVTSKVTPYTFYYPKYLGAFEVMTLAESFISAVYTHSPVVLDYIDQKTVVIKGPPKYFHEIRELIEKHVDTPERAETGGDMMALQKIPNNVPEDRFLTLLKQRLEASGLQVEIQDLSRMPGQTPPSYIKEIE